MIWKIVLVSLWALSGSPSHPGKTASDGCHYCRTNCDAWGVPYGERHCHGGGSGQPLRQAATARDFKTGIRELIDDGRVTQAKLDRAFVKSIQIALIAAGHGVGTADGVYGKRTHAAFEAFCDAIGASESDDDERFEVGVRELSRRLAPYENDYLRYARAMLDIAVPPLSDDDAQQE